MCQRGERGGLFWVYFGSNLRDVIYECPFIVFFKYVGGGGVIVRLAEVGRRKSLPQRYCVTSFMNAPKYFFGDFYYLYNLFFYNIKLIF